MDCPWCARAKEELAVRGIPFDYIDLQEIGKTAKEVTGRDVKTVPQIYVEGKYVGGYEQLMEHLNSTQTQELAMADGDECKACEG